MSDARRAAWAWRSYVTAARSAAAPLVEVRYERLVDAPVGVADDLAAELTPRTTSRRPRSHTSTARPSVATGATDERQLADVLAEAGDLLAELGYVRPNRVTVTRPVTVTCAPAT